LRSSATRMGCFIFHERTVGLVRRNALVWMVVALGVTMIIYHAYTRSSAMARLFGEEGTSVVTRLSAFLLLCIGVQIVITGVVEVARSLTGGSA
jgi:multiple antibiotic resistance protein